MTRILALIAGIVLIGYPAWMLRPQTWHFNSTFLIYNLVIYGSVLLGIAVHVWRARWSGLSLFPFGLFKAGMRGVLAAATAYFVAGGIYGVITYGDFYSVIGGNLWGLLFIFWGVFGASVSAGIALLFYAWRGAAGRRPPGGSGLGTPPS